MFLLGIKDDFGFPGRSATDKNDIPVLDNFDEVGYAQPEPESKVEAAPAEVTEAHPIEEPRKATPIEVTEAHPLSVPEEVHVSPQEVLDVHDEDDREGHDDVHEGGEWHEFSNPQSNDIVVNGK